MTDSGKPGATVAVASAELLREWLRLAGGNLPGEFLRTQGQDPAVLSMRGAVVSCAGSLVGFLCGRPFTKPPHTFHNPGTGDPHGTMDRPAGAP